MLHQCDLRLFTLDYQFNSEVFIEIRISLSFSVILYVCSSKMLDMSRSHDIKEKWGTEGMYRKRHKVGWYAKDPTFDLSRQHI